MAEFWLGAMAMLIVAISIIVLPLLRVRGVEEIQGANSNRDIHDIKLQEIDQDLRDGLIGESEVENARVDLDRELIHDISQQESHVISQRKPILAMVVTIIVSTLALLMYSNTGRFDAIEIEPAKVAMTENSQPSVDEMTRTLEAHIKQSGGTGEEWAMLARAYKHLNRYPEAIDAFNSALKTGDVSAQLLLEKAEVLALQNNQSFNEESRELVMRALEINPDDLNSLWFAGVAEFQAGHYRESIRHLIRLNEETASDSQLSSSVRFYVQRARNALIEKGVDVASMDELLPVVMAGTTDTGTRVEVSVNLASELRSKVSGEDIVFIYAKARSGPKMPLAVQRLTVSQLPTVVTLDDSMAMVEGMNISTFKQLRVGARVSKSGNAIAQSGDLIGEVNADAEDSEIALTIIIDKIVN